MDLTWKSTRDTHRHKHTRSQREIIAFITECELYIYIHMKLGCYEGGRYLKRKATRVKDVGIYFRETYRVLPAKQKQKPNGK